MHLIKLSATNSTNSYLRVLSIRNSIKDYTVVSTNNQTQGKGQMGTIWDSQTDKNLTISVFKRLFDYKFESPFLISIVTSMAILKALELFSIPKLSVKWPNDILSADKKICGVLIENVIKQNNIKASIIGIGLNVNQTVFDNLPKASSLKIISGKVYDLDELISSIVKYLKIYFSLLKEGKEEILKAEYESHLFRINKPSTFVDAEGAKFTGFIKGISNLGQLQVILEDDVLKEFSLKEITLLY